MTPAEMAEIHAACFVTPAPWSPDTFATYASDPLTICAFLHRGFGILRVVADEAELLTLAVSPDQQRRGIARALLHKLSQAAAAQGATTLFLEVNAQNAPAIALYRSEGFIQSGERTGYYRTPDGQRQDALLFSTQLRHCV